MMAPTLEILKEKIKQLKHAIMKPEEKESGKSYLVETLDVATDGNIVCSSDDTIQKEPSVPFPVTLRYINKEKGEYIVIEGLASKQLFPLTAKLLSGIEVLKSTIKIKINSAKYFEKEESASMENGIKKSGIWKLKYGWASVFRKAS
jgi:hypothetical protein